MDGIEAQLSEILHGVAGDVVRDYVIADGDSPASGAEERELCGILGFTGQELCGSVIVVASDAALRATNPVTAVPVSRWLAELTNQIVGRFKNELLRRGADVEMSIPVVLRATRVEPLLQRALPAIRFTVAGGALTVWLEFEGSIELHTRDESSLPSEGDALMF